MRIKSIIKILLVVSATLALLGSNTVKIIFAQALADANDKISVTQPAPGGYLIGNATTTFVLTDDDRSSIPYTVSLKNTMCTSVISVIKSGNAASGQTQNITWNSAGPLQSVSSVADGKYCLEVCGSFKNGNTNYSACNSRFVNTRNNNKSPQFTNPNPSDTALFSDEVWSYDFNASDPEGDKLTFVLLQAPSFLSLNSYTGYMQTSGGTKATGDYAVKVQVKDSFGGSSTTSFTLKVRNRPVSSSSSTTSASSTSSSSTSSTSSSTTSQELVPEIIFLNPQFGDELSGDENIVKWEINNIEELNEAEVKLILLSGNEETVLAEVAGDETEYSWNVSELADGDEYRLELRVNFDGETYTEQVSGFKIVNNPAGPGDPTSRPLIENVRPEPNSVVNNVLRPEITGEFVSPSDAEIDLNSILIEFDGVERDWCNEVTQTSFKCIPDVDLRKGKHNVRVAISDTKNRTGVTEWSFEVEIPNENEGDGLVILGRVIDTAGILVTLGVCLALLLLFIVPWVLYLIWRRRREETNSSSYSYEQETKATTTNADSVSSGYDSSNYYSTTDGASDNLSTDSLTSVTDMYGGLDDSSTEAENTDYIQPAGYTDIDVDTETETNSTTSTSGSSPVEPTNLEPASQGEVDYAKLFSEGSSKDDNSSADVSSNSNVGQSSQTVSTSQTSSEELDPLQFDTYEDYLAAVTAQQSGGNGNNAGANTGTTTSTTTSTSSNDYADLYTTSPNTGASVDDNSDNNSGKNSGNNNDNPDWLNPL